MSIHKIESCRVCSSSFLIPVVKLGQHCLHGQFPEDKDPDPVSMPIEVVRCPACGLVQSLYYCDPVHHFSKGYGYRSGISNTMRSHLTALAEEASTMVLNKVAPRVLDIACNDGFLLNAIPFGTGVRVGIDPSDVPVEHPGISFINGFFPDAMLLTQKFDLITSIACFYSVPDPVAFAKAVKSILNRDGVWVCEVADLYSVLQNVAYDFWCAEHLTLISPFSMSEIARRAELKIVRAEPNKCNGGSMRYYLTHRTNGEYEGDIRFEAWSGQVAFLVNHARTLKTDVAAYDRFANSIDRSKKQLIEAITKVRAANGTVHTLGASTKLNVVLQSCGLDHRVIEMASDRDPRKVGKVTPGTRIPIVSEEESRSHRPNLYLTILPFVGEILAREAEAGSKTPICFALPWPVIKEPQKH